MAGLTKAQRAERDAKNSAQTSSAQAAGEAEKQPPKADKGPKAVAMVRAEPMHARGPVSADVHPDEVENWKAAGWKVA